MILTWSFEPGVVSTLMIIVCIVSVVAHMYQALAPRAFLTLAPHTQKTQVRGGRMSCASPLGMCAPIMVFSLLLRPRWGLPLLIIRFEHLAFMCANRALALG